MLALLQCTFGRAYNDSITKKETAKNYSHPDQCEPAKVRKRSRKNSTGNARSVFLREYNSSELTLSPLVARTKICTLCQKSLKDRNVEDLRIAKVGSSYFCFCNDICWGTWLPQYCSPEYSPRLTISESPLAKSIQKEMSMLQTRTNFKLPVSNASGSNKSVKRTVSFRRKRERLEIIQNSLKVKSNVL
mmetsp:Transcript_4978/g.6284  ORF Transcript_4978/g.6284 Transcript_4978/m.6284 type:complete len:189 (-) Transcript_4978:221-787(-)